MQKMSKWGLPRRRDWNVQEIGCRCGGGFGFGVGHVLYRYGYGFGGYGGFGHGICRSDIKQISDFMFFKARAFKGTGFFHGQKVAEKVFEKK